jgi:biotin carboxyl carrier protein
MPGKIIKILVEPGSKVTTGQVMLVMEAMKMEYTLKAQAEGIVEKIECAPGQQVALGQLLVKMEVE